MQHIPEDYATLLKSVPPTTLKLYLKASVVKIFQHWGNYIWRHRYWGNKFCTWDS